MIARVGGIARDRDVELDAGGQRDALQVEIAHPLSLSGLRSH